MPPSLELCHIFLFVEPGAPEAARLREAGLVESFRRAHPGQGTANLCYCFDNAYLELLWLESAEEAKSPAIARTGLAERAGWRANGASPFGIALRAAGPLPFVTWDFTPSYLPPGMAIPVSLESEDPAHPFIFQSPGNARPDAWTDGRAGNRQSAAGLAEIAGVRLSLPDGAAPGRDLEALVDAGLLTVEPAVTDHPRMVLTVSRQDGEQPRRLSLPEFEWVE
ncbi:VOC family protein [Azospirillum sp. SYSU D00513]|uniref:VOC family protein n=1 Tax=Azospirillum sp. SYSU D00513 TaxID=2812561 RepID=UPI001A979304|nr:VOC family protein [Azospirillum sp. SYSU D00513]